VRGMSKAQVKIEIDGNLINIEDFLSDTNKTYYAEPIKDGEIEGLRPIAEKERCLEIIDEIQSLFCDFERSSIVYEMPRE
jgi:hypothetical protein